MNDFFNTWLIENGLFTPRLFLTTLSAFELISGLMLVAGLLVRPLALVWALLVWTFVMALPVVTAAGVTPGVATFESPAMLVQIRDIGLSGMAFVLFAIGAGAWSLDQRLFGATATRTRVAWNPLGLLLTAAGGGHYFRIGRVRAGFAELMYPGCKDD